MEPDASQFSFPSAFDAPEDLVALGADLQPGTLLAAYRSGFFPMGIDWYPDMGWWSPDPRGVLLLDDFKASRSLRQSAKHFEVRVDTRFEDVLAACADPQRPGAWIDDRIRAAYLELHRLGWAHSVEAFKEGELVGGLYGVAIGGLFAGESMFHHARDASKVALAGLVERLSDEHRGARLLDVQWQTDHLRRLGVSEISRGEYLARLARALELPLPAAFDSAT